MLSAYKKVSQKQGGTLPVYGQVATDVYDVAQDDDVPLERLQGMMSQLENGRYDAPILNGWVIAKSNGGYRPLAVPPFWDRVLQRAVGQVLTPCLEQLMDSGSYGYRPGRSRHNAKDQIQRYWRAGYHWVFESDVKDFFDSVQHDWLEVRLRALFGEDPLVAMLMSWVAADVSFEGEVIQRKAGLPQGSPLSPLLANLVLDDFDSDMQKAGYKLVRYADDFIVMCKSPVQAKRVEDRVRASLNEHGLVLNDAKTHIKNLDEGLKYLGFMFVNDMVVDASGQSDATGGEVPVSPVSWLAQVTSRKLHSIAAKPTDKELQVVSAPPGIVQVGERDDTGVVLCITGPVSLVSTRAERLRVTRDEEVIVEQPWQHIQALVLLGNHHITTPALRAAMAAHVCVHMVDGMGNYQGTAWGGEPLSGHQLWLDQQQTFADPERCLVLAVSVIDARLRHMAEVLRNRGAEGYKEIRLLLKELPRAKNLSQLNGYEGAATARYFKSVATLLPVEFEFTGRNRRPPKDPFNVMLSLGYSLLYGYTDSLIRVSGLLPWLGFYHQPHGLHRTLASDLMEPFRHLIERKALAMIRKGQIKPGDFKRSDGGMCLMDNKALKHYLVELTTALEGDLQGEPTALAENRLTSKLLEQNRSLIGQIRHGQAFTAWRSNMPAQNKRGEQK